MRLGLAFTALELSEPLAAEKALERALELDETNVEALCGLAHLALKEERLAEGLSLLKRAYAIEPTSAPVLNQLANHFFLTGNHPKAQSLARRAFANASAAALRGESCYHVARCYHAQGDFGSARQWYTQACKEAPALLPALFGLGQMHLAQKDPKKVFSNIYTHFPHMSRPILPMFQSGIRFLRFLKYIPVFPICHAPFSPCFRVEFDFYGFSNIYPFSPYGTPHSPHASGWNSIF